MRDFQSVIGKETRQQCLEKWGGKPDIIMACVGGGSNAMGIFHEFVEDREIRLIGVEAGGEGVNTSKHAATLTKGTPGVLHGSYSYLLQVCGVGCQGAGSWAAGWLPGVCTGECRGVGPRVWMRGDADQGHARRASRHVQLPAADEEGQYGFRRQL